MHEDYVIITFIKDRKKKEKRKEEKECQQPLKTSQKFEEFRVISVRKIF